MKFKNFKFVTIMLIFTMLLLGGILPAFSNEVFAAESRTYTVPEDAGPANMYKLFATATVTVDGYNVSVKLDLRDKYSVVHASGVEDLFIDLGDGNGKNIGEISVGMKLSDENGEKLFFESVGYSASDGEKSITFLMEGDEDFRAKVNSGIPFSIVLEDFNTNDWHFEKNLSVSFGSDIELEKAAEHREYSLENMIALMLNGISGALNRCVALAMGHQVTIDDLVFNHYPDTQLSYFQKAPENGDEYSEIIWGKKNAAGESTGEGGLHETINKWYSFFRKIAIIGYMVILVYMGIRMMMSSTGEKMAQYKTLFMYWVIGIAILFFAPYFMKYAIELNNTFVRLCDDYKGKAIAEVTGGAITEIVHAPIKNSSGEGLYVDIDSDPFDKPTVGEGQALDYMSKISQDAHTSLRFALALTYLILTWQLITLIIHYYKRLMITGFLIVIFPIVTLSYAIDKIADGKSQGFNKWLKEYILNVFIQSFHAIVYVFVCCTVYAGMGNPKTGDGTDYVLVIVGATFLFTGEEIIKKIFSQESNTATKSLAATAAKAAAVVGGAKILKTVASNTVGKNNPVSRVNTIRNTWKSSDARANAANMFANAKPTELRNNRDSAIESIDNNASLNETQKAAAKTAATNVANSIDTLKNSNKHTSEELATAYATILNATNGKGADQAVAEEVQARTREMLNNSGISEDQLNAMAMAEQTAAHMVANGITDTVEIKRRVKAELAYAFEGMDESQKARYEKMVITHMALYGTNRGFTWNSTVNDVNRTKDYIDELDRSFDKEDGGYTFTLPVSTTEEALTEDGIEVNEENKKMMMYVIALNNRDKIDLETNFASIEYVKKHKDDNDATRAIFSKLQINKDEDGEWEEADDEGLDTMRHVFASKVLSGSASDELKTKARRVCDEYEVDSRDGYYDDELSIHEVIENLRSGDSDKMNTMTRELYNARRRSNQDELEITRAIGTDMLVEDYGDIYEDATESTFYFDGMSREDILKQRKKANQNRWAAYFTGGIIKPKDTTVRYSDGFFGNNNNTNNDGSNS